MTILAATGTTGTTGSTGSTGTSKTSGATATNATTKANDNLGKDAFLKLLVAQLKYQNPLSPMDGSAFIAQTAQLSMTESIQAMATMQQNTYADSAKRTATEMVGRTVVYDDDNGNEVEGVVTAARMNAGAPVLFIGKKQIALDAVLEVRASAPAAAASASALPTNTTPTTPAATTPAASTPTASTAPASTAPASTAPASTAPASTPTASTPTPAATPPVTTTTTG